MILNTQDWMETTSFWHILSHDHRDDDFTNHRIWLENLDAKVYIGFYIWFEKEEDKIAFILRWV